VHNGANYSLYKQRIEILKSSGKKSKLMCGLMELDYQFNVNNLLELLIKDEPSIWEYRTCNTEARQSVKPLTFIPINLGELPKGKYIKE